MIVTFAFAILELFLTDVILHLFAVAKGNETTRRITKILLMPLLAAAFFLMWCSFSSKSIPWKIIIALLLGGLGDFCLLNHRHPIGFPLGLAAFFTGHIFYIMQIITLIAAPSLTVIALFTVIYGTGAVFTYKRLAPYLSKRLKPGCIIYTLMLCTISAAAAIGTVTSFGAGTFMVFAGTLFFMLSDTILSFEIFRGETKYGNFKVMLSYILAQLLLAAGFYIWMI